MAAWLLLVWMALWGRADLAVVAGGIVVIALTYLATRFPALPVSPGRIGPVALARALGAFVADLVVSSAVIGWYALRGAKAVRGGIVGVRFRSTSDVMLIMVANSISLRPGSLVLEVHRAESLLYVHAMPVHDRAGAERVRNEVLETERRLMRVFGRPLEKEAP
ncbi:Na+/H+ antiporter subunit E [Thermomonospora cellulosilytica]|uniref:Multicomponent Na+:H+ antiporter subunit E n=1 Tax=Thermomonospora cellulosilytica TaxID=1411118 RepID=A0A7W3MTM0_9ACTN|nr:Na+/H+ antiporter subunit E [Thermomonospora cellulosilytica]MBA9001669.1 multicomponent Na+:H+ antiporter subunit E [Thermomonospora cellulosilytica]